MTRAEKAEAGERKLGGETVVVEVRVQVEVLEVEVKVKVWMNDVAVALPLTVRMAVKRGRQREASSRC